MSKNTAKRNCLLRHSARKRGGLVNNAHEPTRGQNNNNNNFQLIKCSPELKYTDSVVTVQYPVCNSTVWASLSMCSTQRVGEINRA